MAHLVHTSCVVGGLLLVKGVPLVDFGIFGECHTLSLRGKSASTLDLYPNGRTIGHYPNPQLRDS